MNRKIRILVVGLLALGALEFGLLGASAAGLVGGDGHSLPPIPQRGNVQITATPEPTQTPEGGTGGPASIELLRPDPSAIACDGGHPSLVRVFVRDSSGKPVADGTYVNFSVFNGSASPYYAQTDGGNASTSVVLYSDGYSYQPNVVVYTGEMEAAVRLRCKPNSDCPVSPPPGFSPPCAPPPTSTPVPCDPSPPSDSVSPPCATPEPTFVSPPPCNPSPGSGSVSPPCATPTFVSPPSCNPSPASAPFSLPCATPTPRPNCAPFAPSPPCKPTPTPAPAVCADVTGDGRVTQADVAFVLANTLKRQPDLRADLNHDRRVNFADVAIVVRQLGRRC